MHRRTLTGVLDLKHTNSIPTPTSRHRLGLQPTPLAETVLHPMLTRRTTFTRAPLTAAIGVVEITMMLLTHGIVTNGDLDSLMRATFKAGVGTGRRGILSRVTRLTAMSHRAGLRWTTTMMLPSGVLHLQIGEKRAGTLAETGSPVPKEIVGGRVTMVGNRGNATDTRTDGLQTAKMMARSQRRIDLGNLDLVGILVENKPTATNAAVVGREK